VFADNILSCNDKKIFKLYEHYLEDQIEKSELVGVLEPFGLIFARELASNTKQKNCTGELGFFNIKDNSILKYKKTWFAIEPTKDNNDFYVLVKTDNTKTLMSTLPYFSNLIGLIDKSKQFYANGLNDFYKNNQRYPYLTIDYNNGIKNQLFNSYELVKSSPYIETVRFDEQYMHIVLNNLSADLNGKPIRLSFPNNQFNKQSVEVDLSQLAEKYQKDVNDF